jgi:hypothetical protein
MTDIESGDGARVLDLASGRRAFLRAARLSLAGAAALAGTGPAIAAVENTQALTDADILNFALNLEYLEAEFYQRAVYGEGLATADVTGAGTLGNVVGGRRVQFESQAIRGYAREIAKDELAHVRFLRAGLGSAKQARPKIDFRNAFTAAARAAGLVGPQQTFDAFANDTNFLLAAFIFEDVGVTAYKGAARFLTNKDFLEAAAGILAVEAYHAGEIRTLLYQRGLIAEARAISMLRDSVDGPADKDQGIRRDRAVNIVPTDKNGIAYGRSPSQVLAIVYLGGTDKGGFFPNGVNGTIS